MPRRTGLLAVPRTLSREGFSCWAEYDVAAEEVRAGEQQAVPVRVQSPAFIACTALASNDRATVSSPACRQMSAALGKGVEPHDLLEAVRVIARGEALLSPAATQTLIARFIDTPTPSTAPPPVAFDVLTAREREIVAMVAAGLDNNTIAEQLFLSPLTVKTHVNRAMTKMDTRDRVQLVVLAYQTGFVTPPHAPR